jgi:hypothetical protein
VRPARFEAELIEGHKGLSALMVPFDPEAVWKSKPVKLSGRRFGWLVQGTLNGLPFDGYIGFRWERFFILVDPDQQLAAKASLGNPVRVVLRPSSNAKAFAHAFEQSKQTTQPKKAREDAIDLSGPARNEQRLHVSGRTRKR